jgi:hypothetical protein
MPRPALSERYVVAPGPAGQLAQLAFCSRDNERPGFYPIDGVGAACLPHLPPLLHLAYPYECLPDAPQL